MNKHKKFKEFIPFLEAENIIFDKCQRGEMPEIMSHRPILDLPEKYVRATFLRHLIRLGLGEGWVQEAGVKLRGAVILGDLDLSDLKIGFPLVFIECRFKREEGSDYSDLNLMDVELDGVLNLTGTALRNLVANRVLVKGSVFLGNGFLSKGNVNFVGAKIEGQLTCNKSELNGNVFAMSAQGASVARGVYLDNCIARGQFSSIGPRLVKIFRVRVRN